MPPFPVPLGGRSRLLVLLAGVLVAALAVTGGVVAWWTGGRDDGSPAGGNQAEPAGIVPSGAPDPVPAARPNIVTILTDDMRTDDLRWMPAVRSLVRDQGLEFRNSFSPNPICAPARATLLTGQYSHNTGVLSVEDDNSFGAFDDRRTIATSLNAAGYNTLFLGKYVNGYGLQDAKATGKPSLHYVPPGWTDWYGAVQPPAGSGFGSGGTYSYYHVVLNHDGRIEDRYKGQYQSDVEGRLASELVRRYHRSPKPFFLYLAPIAPHFGAPRESDDPPLVTQPGSDRVERFKTPARPRWARGRFDGQIHRASGLPSDGGPSEANISDKARPMRDRPELSPAERAVDRTVTRQRAETLFAFDRQVARLVATLKATGEYADTVVMFTSDNGYFLGEHRMRKGKIKAHEPSLRVPFLVSGPGIPQGRRYDPITTDDVTATILDIGRARPPHPPDGLSVVGSFRGDRGWTVPVVTEGEETGPVFRDTAGARVLGFHDHRTTIGIRTARWKYIRYNNGDGELYDLDRDPNEMRSVYGVPRYAGLQAAMQRLWTSYKDCAGVTCRRPMPERAAARTGRQRGRHPAAVTRRRCPLRLLALTRPGAARGDVARDGRRGGDVEGVHPGAHRDHRAPVRGLLPPRRQPVPLAAEEQGHPVEPPHGVVDGDGVVGQGEGDGREPGRGDVRHRVVPVLEPGVRHREHRPHRHLDGAAVERVGAAGGEQHGVDPERRGAAEDGADVGVVDDVLQHHDRAGPGEHLVDRR